MTTNKTSRTDDQIAHAAELAIASLSADGSARAEADIATLTEAVREIRAGEHAVVALPQAVRMLTRYGWL